MFGFINRVEKVFGHSSPDVSSVSPSCRKSECTRISLRRPNYLINSVGKTNILFVSTPHRRSTTVVYYKLTLTLLHLKCRPKIFNSPCPGQIQTYFLKKSLCFAAVFKLCATGLEICFTAKLANLNKGNAPTTMMKTKL